MTSILLVFHSTASSDKFENPLTTALPVNSGGLGFRNAFNHALLALLASADGVSDLTPPFVVSLLARQHSFALIDS